MKILVWTIIIAISLLSCREKKHNVISDSLGKALLENKITNKKTSDIIDEYAFVSVRGGDSLASIYSNRIIAVIDLGGDSVIIDKARNIFKEENSSLWNENTKLVTSSTALELKMIAGKDLENVKKYLGDISTTETISPSNTPCPCKKYSFKNGDIEIVFINDRADWITVYKPLTIDIGDSKIIDHTFSGDFTYIKVKTR